MDDLIFRVVKPMTPYTNYTYLTTSPPPGGAFWVFPPRPSLSGHVGRHKLYWRLQFLVSWPFKQSRDVQERAWIWKSAGNSNKLQSSSSGKCKQWIWCIHPRAPTKTCAFWSLVTFNSGRWNCSLWGRKWHFPFRGAKTSYDGVCFHFQTACWIFVMGH